MGTEFTKRWWCTRFGLTESELIAEAGGISEKIQRLFVDSDPTKAIGNSNLMRRLVGKQPDSFPIGGNMIRVLFTSNIEERCFLTLFVETGTIRNVPSFKSMGNSRSVSCSNVPYTISKGDFFDILRNKIRPRIDSGEITSAFLEKQHAENVRLRNREQQIEQNKRTLTHADSDELKAVFKKVLKTCGVFTASQAELVRDVTFKDGTLSALYEEDKSYAVTYLNQQLSKIMEAFRSAGYDFVQIRIANIEGDIPMENDTAVEEKTETKKTTRREFLSVNEAAEYLNVSGSTIYELINRKKIPSYRILRTIRIKRTDLMRFINKQRVRENLPEQSLFDFKNK